MTNVDLNEKKSGNHAPSSPTSASSSSQQPAQNAFPRTRKKSLFSKASSKPSLPKEALPSHFPAVTASQAPENTQLAASASVATPPSSAAPQHKRSPSSSFVSSASKRELDTVRNVDQNANSQTLGRRGITSTGQTSSWYQRGPLSRALPFKNSPSSPTVRDRSASVSTAENTASKASMSTQSVSEQYGIQGQDAGTARWTGGASPGSPTRLMRSFSRRSVYSVHGDPSASITSSTESPKATDDGPVSQTKRKLFSRQSKINNGMADGSPYQSDRLHAGGSSSQGGFLRRRSSRSLLKGKGRENEEGRCDPMASTDTLSSTATTNTSRGLSKRTSDLVHRTTSFAAHWGSRNKSTSSMSGDHTQSQEATEYLVGEQAREGSVAGESAFSSESQSQGHRDALAVPGTSPSMAELQAEGIPKRLSGWLFNMIGSESHPAPSQYSANNLTTSDSLATLKHNTSGHLMQQQTDLDAHPASKVHPPSSAVKSRAGGLLSTLAASGRSRMDASSSNSTTLQHPARSGLDRALRYFTDGHEPEQCADEGIWLLGVWHGSSDTKAVSQSLTDRLGPAIAVSTATPDRGDRDTTATESSKRESDAGHDDSSVASNAQRTRETSPSIASAHSVASASENRKRESTGATSASFDNTLPLDEGAFVVRNPPTPQTSPNVESTRAAGMSGRLGREAGLSSTTRLLAAIAISAEKAPSFQADFSSRIWCTYRSHFAPISRDGSITQSAERAAEQTALAEQANALASADTTTMTVKDSPTKFAAASDASHSQGGLGAAFGITMSSSPPAGVAGSSSPAVKPSNVPASGLSTAGGGGGLGEKMGIPNLWNRATAAAQAYGLAGRSGLTTDAGWGCMLRTGQSVLANALLNVHLGRHWRRTSKPLPAQLAPLEHESPDAYMHWRTQREAYAKYVRLLSWFMDEPSTACPFGVHRMAREGKRLGKEVGEWFGPSTAAGAIKKLVDEFEGCGMGVSVATDGVVYLNQVRAAAVGADPERPQEKKPVLVLIGIRLGLEGVHPMYHDSVKATFSFPQSVGIAGGRPSSSYYFVGYQANSLFYLDPHYVRHSVPFKHPPPGRQDDFEWWSQSYAEQDLATFHTDRPRRMPMKSLDPSMLLGFLIEDETSLEDFLERVKSLPRPIFSVQESMPKWMMTDSQDDVLNHDDGRAIESISETSLDESPSSLSAPASTGQPTEKERERRTSSRHTSKRPEHSPRGLEPGERSSQTGVTTPRSEATFEFIDRQAASSSSPVVAPLHASPRQAVAPVAFPTLESVEDGSEEFITSESEPIASSGDASLSFVQTTQPSSTSATKLPDSESIQTASLSAGDIESNWEDLQEDVHIQPVRRRNAVSNLSASQNVSVQQ